MPTRDTGIKELKVQLMQGPEFWRRIKQFLTDRGNDERGSAWKINQLRLASNEKTCLELEPRVKRLLPLCRWGARPYWIQLGSFLQNFDQTRLNQDLIVDRLLAMIDQELRKPCVSSVTEFVLS